CCPTDCTAGSCRPRSDRSRSRRPIEWSSAAATRSSPSTCSRAPSENSSDRYAPVPSNSSRSPTCTTACGISSSRGSRRSAVAAGWGGCSAALQSPCRGVLTHELEQALIVFSLDESRAHHVAITARREVPDLVQDVCRAVRHPSAEVPPDRSQYDYDTGGHVLAAVVPRALDDGDGSRVAHRKPVPGAAGGEQLPTGRS